MRIPAQACVAAARSGQSRRCLAAIDTVGTHVEVASMKEAIIGLVGILLGAFVADGFGRQTSRRRERDEHIATLNLARTELCFFSKRLRSLDDWISGELAKLSSSRNPTISYFPHDLYPGVLGECKVKLAAYDRCLEVVSWVTECHYELCCLRVELNRMQSAVFEEKPCTRDGSYMETHLKKLGSFVRSTREKCEAAMPALDSQGQVARAESFGLAKILDSARQTET